MQELKLPKVSDVLSFQEKSENGRDTCDTPVIDEAADY